MRTFMFIVGIIFLIDGIFIVFNKRYFEFMSKKFWDKGELDEKLFPGKSGFWYNKISRGVGSILVGLIFFLFSIFAF